MNSRSSPGRSGFRRWYERQLFEAFGWLAVCLLCGVVFAAVLEFVGLSTPGLTPIVTLVVLYLVGLAGVAAWRRFWSMLSRAQAFAEGATCAQCGGYGLFDVIFHDEAIAANCRRCGNRWIISGKRAEPDPPVDRR